VVFYKEKLPVIVGNLKITLELFLKKMLKIYNLSKKKFTIPIFASLNENNRFIFHKFEYLFFDILSFNVIFGIFWVELYVLSVKTAESVPFPPFKSAYCFIDSLLFLNYQLCINIFFRTKFGHYEKCWHFHIKKFNLT
jgi:hypothetical protein